VHDPAYTVTNLAGRTDINATISLTSNESTAALTTHIDETDADPITAVDTESSFGSVSQMSAVVHDKTGSRVDETRVYFSMPGSYPGSVGTHFDATTYSYDESGRVERTVDPIGTIREMQLAIGRLVALIRESYSINAMGSLLTM
jgi:hypothetical protein